MSNKTVIDKYFVRFYSGDERAVQGRRVLDHLLDTADDEEEDEKGIRSTHSSVSKQDGSYGRFLSCHIVLFLS